MAKNDPKIDKAFDFANQLLLQVLRNEQFDITRLIHRMNQLFLLLRGDLLSLVYVVLLFCYGLVTPVCVSASFTIILLILSIVSTLLRYLVQTPLVCQTSRPSSGAWRLLLRVGSPRRPDS